MSVSSNMSHLDSTHICGKKIVTKKLLFARPKNTRFTGRARFQMSQNTKNNYCLISN